MAGHIYNELIITFTDNNETGMIYEADITAENIVEESMKLVQSINDENYLKFGGCIASEFSIDLLNTTDRRFSQSLVGRWISVKLIQHTISNRPIYPSNSLYPSDTLCPGYELDVTTHYIFSGKIDSAKLNQEDLNVRTIIAYDAMAILHATDATNYVFQHLAQSSAFTIQVAYDYALQNNGKIQISKYSGDNWEDEITKESFDRDGNNTPPFQYVRDYFIKNDAWRQSSSTISYGELLKYCCEDLAAFGIIVPDGGKGSFKMITLKGNPIVYQYYEKLQPEEYVSTGYNDYSFLTEGNSSGKTASAISGFPMATDGAVGKTYDFTKNPTIYDPSSGLGQSRTSTPFDRLIMTTSIGYRIAMNSENGDCAFDTYRPLKATVEGTHEQIVGSPITIIANKTNPDGSYVEENGVYVKEYINTYVFKRTLTGIQALTDEIETKGQR